MEKSWCQRRLQLRLLVALWAKSEWKMTREGCKRTRWLATQDHAGWARSRGATTWRGGPCCESQRHGERNHGRWFGKRESCGMVGFVMGCNFAAGIVPVTVVWQAQKLWCGGASDRNGATGKSGRWKERKAMKSKGVKKTEGAKGDTMKSEEVKKTEVANWRRGVQVRELKNEQINNDSI